MPLPSIRRTNWVGRLITVGKFAFTIPGTIPTLNEYTKANRTNRYVAAKLKREAQAQIIQAIGDEAPRFKGKVTVYFTWIRPNARSDKDNVSFSKKFVLDALQEAGVIESDSWNLCDPLDIGFSVNRTSPRVEVVVMGSLI